MIFGGFGSRKNSTTPFFVLVVAAILSIWLILLGITLTLTLRYSLSTMQEKIDNGLSSIAETLSSYDSVRQALSQGSCPEALLAYLDDLVEKTADLDILSIADEHSVRIYHIVHERIGGSFVGGDEQRALAGERYFSDATGTMGYQHRYFSPVLEDDGKVIGFVMASTTRSRIEALHSDINRTYGKLFLLLTVCTLLFSGFLAFYLKKQLRGAKPEDLLRVYLVQNDILNSLDEGIISLDTDGKIRFVNAAAVKTLGQHEALLLGRPVDALLRRQDGESLRNVEGENPAAAAPDRC